MIFKLNNLNRSTMDLLPECCSDCGWWQGHDAGWPSGEARMKWAAKAESITGSWGKMALVDDYLQGMIQYGPAELFPRASGLAGGPPDEDAVLITCCLVVEDTIASIRKSLLLAAISELKNLEYDAIETFCHRNSDMDDSRHLLDVDFLRHCGFYAASSGGDLVLMRLELGGIERTYGMIQKVRESLLKRLKKPATAPSPATMCGPRNRSVARIRISS